jgi:hypothetical protein
VIETVAHRIGFLISPERNNQHRKFDHILYCNFLRHFFRERERERRAVASCTYFSFINLISLGVGCEYLFIALLEGARDESNVKDGFSYFICHQSSEGLTYFSCTKFHAKQDIKPYQIPRY